MLKIQNLKTSIEGKEILKGFNLEIEPGSVHILMGPNGSGKSTIAKTIAGDPNYEVTEGKILYESNMSYKNLLEMEVSERAREGVFLAFQYPVEVPGLNNLVFLRMAFNSICKHQGAPELSEKDFEKFALEKVEKLDIKKELLYRNLNEGFSGGEKKQNEILQLSILSPRFIILDETDSGLDVDSLQRVAKGINALRGPDSSLLVITHYHRLLDLVKPDHIHVLIEGQIKKSGDFALAKQIEEKGYDWISR